MSTATLTFNLPEEARDHSLAVNAASLASVIWAVDQRLRGWLKHEHEYKTADAALESVRDLIREEMSDRGMTMDMIE